MKCKIDIYGPYSVISGDYDKNIVKKVTSYPVQGFQYSKAYRNKKWDGRKHLFVSRTGSFPTGLKTFVKDALEETGHMVEIEDHRKSPEPQGRDFSIHGASFDYPYDYQLEACEAVVRERQGVLKMATGSGKTAVSAALIKYFQLPTLFIVPNLELLYQAQAVFLHRLQLTDKEVGIVGDGNWSPGTLVTVAMLPTLEARLDTKECLQLLKSVDVMFIDECHKTGSETWYNVVSLCSAYYRIGLSGTPVDRTDGANLRLLATTGDIIYTISNKELIKRGVTANTAIFWDKVTEPVLGKLPYASAYKQGVVQNEQLLHKIVGWTKTFHKAGLSTMIMCEEIGHGSAIDDALWDKEMFIPHQFIHGEESSDVRRTALDSFSQRNLPVLIISRIGDEGLDVHSIDALILAGSRKSKIKTLQRIGRGLRGKKLIVVEFANFCNKYLLDHSLARLQDYKAEDCFKIVNTGPDLALVKKTWDEL